MTGKQKEIELKGWTVVMECCLIQMDIRRLFYKHIEDVLPNEGL